MKPKGTTMQQATTGKCLCGASSYEFNGEIKFAIQCYCTDCQHVSGGGHLPQVGIPKEGFKSIGAIKTYSNHSDAGNTLYFTFCSNCGSPLYKSTSKIPDMFFVYPGSMDTRSDVSFDTKVFENSRQHWDQF